MFPCMIVLSSYNFLVATYSFLEHLDSLIMVSHATPCQMLFLHSDGSMYYDGRKVNLLISWCPQLL